MRYFNSIAVNGDPMFGMAIQYFGWDQEARARQEAEKYEFRVSEMLYRINATRTGCAVLRAVHVASRPSKDVFSQKVMMIVPNVDAPLKDIKKSDKRYNHDESGKNVAVNAFAGWDDLASATPKGKSFYTDNHVVDPKTGVVENEKIIGTGAGSNTTITFTPQHFIPNDIAPTLGIDNPTKHFEPDEFLLHEIVHGLRQMSGLMNQRKVPFQRGYDNIEEFFAILIANIYRSECGRDKIRKDHGREFIETTEAKFVRKGLNRSHIRQLRREHPLLFSELRKIDVPFNPTQRILNV